MWFKFRYSKSYRRQSGRHRAALSAIRPTCGMTAIPFVLTLASIYIWVEQHHVKANITYVHIANLFADMFEVKLTNVVDTPSASWPVSITRPVGLLWWACFRGMCFFA